MKQQMIVWDIETGPLENALELHEPQFEPDSRLKDVDKIAASLDAKRADWLDECALRAERGRVLAIGFTANGEGVGILQGDEDHILLEWIRSMTEYKGYTFAGFNILNFDLPFIRRRCIVLGIPFPFYSREDKWRPWTVKTYDAMVDWNSGVYRDSISLDALARGLGVGKKTGHGADFAELYKTDREAALSYLRNDIQITYKVCERMLAQ